MMLQILTVIFVVEKEREYILCVCEVETDKERKYCIRVSIENDILINKFRIFECDKPKGSLHIMVCTVPNTPPLISGNSYNNSV